jgi:hypothetical protein
MDQKIHEKITNFFVKTFLKNVFWIGPEPKRNWVGPTQIKYKLLYIWLDSAQPRGLG